MKFNKKGIMMLPLAALLFTSCSPWKGINYEQAKAFIDENYKTDTPVAVKPTKVHEKLKFNAADTISFTFMFYCFDLFYNPTAMVTKIGEYCTDKTCDYEADYIPGTDWSDPDLSPIVSEEQPDNIDSLMKSSEDGSQVVTYATNGKKFKQNLTIKMDIINCPKIRIYNDSGYRSEVTSKSAAKGQVTYLGETVAVDFNYEFSATYTYAE